MIKRHILIYFCMALLWPNAVIALEDAINLYCLKKAYPQIIGLEKDQGGITYLVFKDGDRIIYEGLKPDSPLAVDVKTSMAEIYPLEPIRVVSENSPGRKRPYELFNKLYGRDQGQIKRGLESNRFLGKNIQLIAPASKAFAQAVPCLEKLAQNGGQTKNLLKPEGGFYWRNIAGEKVQSAHSWGIALDLGANSAPYWRWSKQMPHPMQKSYPESIVRLLEERGFIWGGKWREYDLMHFEYRPELICKSKLIRKAHKE